MLNLKKELPNHINNLSRLAVIDLQNLLNQNGFTLAIDGIVGEKTTKAFNEFKSRHKLTNPSEIGLTTLDFLVKSPGNFGIITLAKLKKLYKFTPEKKLELFVSPLNKTCQRFKINSKARLTAFLAQIGHESAGLNYVEELASGKAYEGRKDLGNIFSGDGVRFKGKGLIQVTGRHNVTKLSKYFNIDFVKNPNLLTEPKWASLSAGWFWDSRNLNKYADQNTLVSFKQITKLINGGYNGLTDRINYWNLAKTIF
jgi:putative chitinase